MMEQFLFLIRILAQVQNS